MVLLADTSSDTSAPKNIFEKTVGNLFARIAVFKACFRENPRIILFKHRGLDIP